MHPFMYPIALTAALAAAPGHWQPVPAAELDSLRGGSVGSNGLALTLGIVRQVAVNGGIVVEQRLQLQAGETSATLAGIKPLQIGPDNMVQAAAMPAIVIQNSLDGQRIDSRTVIDASVGSLGLLTALNFQRSLQDALAPTATP